MGVETAKNTHLTLQTVPLQEPSLLLKSQRPGRVPLGRARPRRLLRWGHVQRQETNLRLVRRVKPLRPDGVRALHSLCPKEHGHHFNRRAKPMV